MQIKQPWFKWRLNYRAHEIIVYDDKDTPDIISKKIKS